MNSLIPTRVHGVVDYVEGVVLLLVPNLLGFSNLAAPSTVARVLGAGVIVYSLLTRYELGALRVIPMTVHLVLDALAGIVLIVSPFVLGMTSYPKRAWVPHIVVGIAVLVVVALTHRHSSVEETATARPAL